MDARRLTAPLVAAGLLRRRPAAPPPDVVRETLAESRRRNLRIEVDDGTVIDAVLFLPAGAGPHPVVLLTADGQVAHADRLAADGVAAVPIRAGLDDAAVAAVAAALAGRIDVNPHEIGVIARACVQMRLEAMPHIAFTIDADVADLKDRVLARVTIPV